MQTRMWPDNLIPLGLAARQLGISAEYLRNLTNRGLVRSVRDPQGRRYFRLEEIARLGVERRDRQRQAPGAR